MRHRKTSDIKEPLSTSREDVLVSLLSMRCKEPVLSATFMHSGCLNRPKAVRLSGYALHSLLEKKETIVGVGKAPAGRWGPHTL